MFNRRNPSRPPLPEHQTRIAKLNEAIESLQVAYEETGNPKLIPVLQWLKALKKREQ